MDEHHPMEVPIEPGSIVSEVPSSTTVSTNKGSRLHQVAVVVPDDELDFYVSW